MHDAGAHAFFHLSLGDFPSCASALALAAHVGLNVQHITAGNRYPFNPNPNDNVFWTILFFLILGGIVAGGGAIAQLVAWIGAVFNTHRLADKKWFHILLWGGLAGYLVVLATLGILWPTDVLGGLITWGAPLPGRGTRRDGGPAAANSNASRSAEDACTDELMEV